MAAFHAAEPIRNAPRVIQRTRLVASKPTVLHLAGVVLDCAGEPGAGLTVSSTPAGGFQVYVQGSLPSNAAEETDATGVTGIFNLAPGPLSLTTSLDGDVTTGTIDVFVRANALTYTSLPPAP